MGSSKWLVYLVPARQAGQPGGANQLGTSIEAFIRP